MLILWLLNVKNGVVVGVGWRCVGGRGETLKHAFWRVCVVYVHRAAIVNLLLYYTHVARYMVLLHILCFMLHFFVLFSMICVCHISVMFAYLLTRVIL